jgi:hypothetical protein
LNSYELFNEIVTKIEQLQDALDQLRDIVKAKIRECTPPKETER